MTCRSKYHSRKVTVDGITFDSKKEARRYQELMLLERAGKIKGLQRQVKFVLIPSQRELDVAHYKDDGRVKIEKGKLIERECAYVADFVYQQQLGDISGFWEQVVEDTKGFKTADYIIKRKLMLWVHGIRIKEI